MAYESQISFTLDTICPWTYIAKKRLDRALAEHARSASAAKVCFTVRFLPYQLHPDLPPHNQDRWAWLRDSEFAGSEELITAAQARLTAAAGRHNDDDDDGLALGLAGAVANTLEAHRVLHCAQEERGPAAAGLLVDALFRRYFADGAGPADQGVLVAACVEAGMSETEAKALVVEEDRGGGGRGLAEVRRAVAEQRINGVDSVPTVLLEGRKRDITLVGRGRWVSTPRRYRPLSRRARDGEGGLVVCRHIVTVILAITRIRPRPTPYRDSVQGINQ
ncbi:hypothetical protein RB597_003933 [Gaeumannomyces tritici]